MNDPLKQLEQELARLVPGRPDPHLQARLRETVAAESARQRSSLPAPARRRSWWRQALPLAAAAAFGIGTWVILGTTADRFGGAAGDAPAAASADGQFRPVRAQNTLIGVDEAGIVNLQGGQLARSVRYRFMDSVRFENPEDGSIIEMKVPREEILLVPVQTY
jgi:hypothetical protein